MKKAERVKSNRARDGGRERRRERGGGRERERRRERERERARDHNDGEQCLEVTGRVWGAELEGSQQLFASGNVNLHCLESVRGREGEGEEREVRVGFPSSIPPHQNSKYNARIRTTTTTPPHPPHHNRTRRTRGMASSSLTGDGAETEREHSWLVYQAEVQSVCGRAQSCLCL